VKLTKISKEEIRSVLGQFGIHNADVLIRENVTPEQLIDSMMKNRVYVPAVFVVNKVDTLTPEEAGAFRRISS